MAGEDSDFIIFNSSYFTIWLQCGIFKLIANVSLKCAILNMATAAPFLNLC